MEEEIKLTEEELIFIKELENKLNVSEYSEIRRIINRYIDIAEHNRKCCERQTERIKARDDELQELYKAKEKQVVQIDNIERKYQKALDEIFVLEYQLDKAKKYKESLETNR